jgi:hypothetical protein
MAKVATLTADFRAEAAQFLREIKKVNDESRRTAETIQKELSGALTRLAGLLSVGAFAAFVQSSAQAADQLAKTADRLGVTTERLQALRFAARSAGADVSVLDKALFEAQKRLSDAAQSGSGPAADWISRLNLNIGALRGLAPDQLFERYAASIAQLSSRADQLNAIQGLMGKGTEQLLNLIDGGSAALQQAAADVDQLGLSLSRVDAAQVEAANDAIDRLKAVSEGVGQRIAVALSPYVAAFANQLVEAGKQGDTLRAKLESTARTAFYLFSVATNAIHVFDAAISASAVVVGKALDLIVSGVRRIYELQASGARAIGLKALADDFDAVAKRLSASEDFMVAFSEQASTRVTHALAGIQSLEQIGAEADRILSEARARAQQQAAAQASNQSNFGSGGVPSVDGQVDLERMAAIYAMQQDLTEQFSKEREATTSATIERELQAYADAAQRRYELESQAEEAIRQQKEATTGYTIGLFQALGQKNKVFALAALAIEKVTAIQRILLANAVAAELAFASQLIPGDPTSLARAAAAKAAVLAQGRIQATLVAITGAIEAANLFSAGGNAPGSSTNPVYTQNASANGEQSSSGATPGRVINVNLNGPISGPDASRWLIGQLAELINGNDTIIINSNSAQAREILGR